MFTSDTLGELTLNPTVYLHSARIYFTSATLSASEVTFKAPQVA